MSSSLSSNGNDSSILWSKDRFTIQELINNEYASFSESKSLLVKIHCQKKGCRCVLKNEQALTLKCISQVTLVRGIWSKNGTKLTNQSSNKVINVIITSSNITWFEILNESGQTTPSWNSTKYIIKNKPSSFLIRRDIKCLFPKKTGVDTFQLCLANANSINAGTVLNFVQYKEFFVQKGKKSKEMLLIQCCDNNLSNVFLFPDDKCCISPLAGLNSISGVHNLYSIIQQFQLPLSIRPAYGNLAEWLPSSTDKSSLRLCESYCGELVFLEPLSNPNGERFFVITPEMLDNHQISIGVAQSSHHHKLLSQHSTRVEQFLQSCHPYEGLRYLLRHLTDTTNINSCHDHQSPVNDNQIITLSTSNATLTRSQSKENDSERQAKLDKLFDEIEDIYYYVRTGRFPSHSRSTTSLPPGVCADHRNRLLQLHTPHNNNSNNNNHYQPPKISNQNQVDLLLTPIPSSLAINSNTQTLRPTNHHQRRDNTDDNCSQFTTTNRSLSWTNVYDCENKPPLPPLPVRVYFNVQQDTTNNKSQKDLPPPPPPTKKSSQFIQRQRASFVNNPSYEHNFSTLTPPKSKLIPN